MTWIGAQERDACAPVSLGNLLLWLGVPIEWEHHGPILLELCECSSPAGTSTFVYEEAIAKVVGELARAEHVLDPGVDKIVKHLKQGRDACALLKARGHCFFAEGHPEGPPFLSVNMRGRDHPPVDLLDEHKLRWFYEPESHRRRVWLITRA